MEARGEVEKKSGFLVNKHLLKEKASGQGRLPVRARNGKGFKPMVRQRKHKSKKGRNAIRLGKDAGGPRAPVGVGKKKRRSVQGEREQGNPQESRGS